MHANAQRDGRALGGSKLWTYLLLFVDKGSHSCVTQPQFKALKDTLILAFCYITFYTSVYSLLCFCYY